MIENLGKHDIQTVYMEDMDFNDQISLVSRAELIVMTAGGASPLTMLAPMNCTIIELTFPIFQGAFASRAWASMLGQTFYRVDGTTVGDSVNEKINSGEHLNTDFVINVDEVIEIIKHEKTMQGIEA